MRSGDSGRGWWRVATESVAFSVPRVGVRRRVGYWRITGALVLQVVALSYALSGLIQGIGWWFALVATASAVLVTGAGLRSLGIPRGVVPVLLLVESAAIMTVAFGRGSGLLGIIPTPTTVTNWMQYLQQAMLSIYQQGTPAEALPEFLFLVVGGGCLLALILDTFAVAIRTPAFTAIGIAAVLVVPGALLGDGLDPLALAASAAAYLWLLRCDVRSRRPGTPRPGAALSVGASAVTIAVVLAGTAPGFDQGGATSFTAGGISIGGTVTPLVDLGKDLRRPAAVRALTYTTSAANGQYLKLASLDQFTGSVWKHRERDTNRLSDGAKIGPVAGLSDTVKTTKITTTVAIDNMTSRWLPAPAPVQSVKGLNGTWSWDPDDLTIGGINSTTQGQKYTATSLLLQPTADQLKAAGGFVPVEVQRDLFLPPNLPSIIEDTALTATKDAITEYDKAVALQDYFRDNSFVYSTQTPLKQGYDGDGARVIAKFLEVKSGYCVHFASAMALMARTLGIPSRVAEGYLPGATSGGTATNPGEYTVTSDDLHAWPELYFAGVGWVPFEPTVGRGTVPDYTRPQTDPAAAPPSSAATSSSAPRALVPTDPANPAGSATFTPTSGAQPLATGIGVALLVIGVLLIPAVWRRMRRRRRLRELTDEWGGASLVWDELRDTVRDLGWTAPPTETPRVFAGRVATAVAGTPAEDAVLRLLGELERDAYGPPTRRWAGGLSDDLETVLSALEAQAGPVLRTKALLIPVSLLPAGWPSAVRPRGAA
ncbi:Transglutaminase-like superfamily protein [Leifsonia sp. 98AMF]|nr:Transglutaminase-like superfamily protein [Leifsonia sp. 197AMF]SDJ07558.1 Transglutaminase-like superfamily protein [Leifsonia sp. 466MF]SDJ63741.1 Transglutaminase-like superfamily protein [Leifsonia sp. 157MF]SDN28482.1 Transglutaminase-like superfamily protein [Leifsonia sp. 509MF]SEM92579.1 Transglutaminase-like superfamily protein [Leifsonia sp. 467MF]SFM31135.1 Transglutaminase-like superfamily protein [Leifsonia sp. 98AMF]